MTYIKKYSTSFPAFRITDKVLHPRLGKKGQHAICYVDEDLITLAYSAVQDLGEDVDAILFATTTPLFKNRYHASFLLELLGLKQGVLALDMGTTSRAGTDILLMADKLIRGGEYKNVLLVASDVYYPGIGKETRSAFGHGSVAMVLSPDTGIAKLSYAKSFSSGLSEEFNYKGETTKYDTRFAATEGFKKNISLVLNDIEPSGKDRVIMNSPYNKLATGLLRKAGFDLEQQLMKDTIGPSVGNTGACHGLLQIISALESGKGRTILLDYLNGTNAIIVESDTAIDSSSTDAVETEHIEMYQDYLQLRKQGKFTSKGYESIAMFSSEMIQERDKEGLLYLKANKCTNCDTIYYINAARCNSCHHTEFEKIQLQRTGTVYSVTSEYYFPASFPPTNMVVIDLDGGGRVTVQQTDDMFPNDNNTIGIGDKVMLVLRKMMENDTKPNYFWKCKKL